MVSSIRALCVVVMVVLPAQAFGLTSGIEGGGFQLAYIDPGAGSFVIQALLATIAGIAVTGRIYWSKIKKILGMASVDADEDSDADDE